MSLPLGRFLLNEIMATANSRARRIARTPVPKSVLAQGYFGKLGNRPLTAVVVSLLCVGLIAGALGLVVYPQAMASFHWWKAQRAANDYEFHEARHHLEKCLAVWNNSGETHFALARACRRDGDLTTARKQLQEAKRLDWSTDAIDLEYKLIEAQRGQVRPVERILRSYLEADHPDKIIIMEAMVLGCLKQNFLDDAYDWSSRWIKLTPEAWQPRLLRANALYQGQRAQLAMQEYQNVLDLKPDQSQARLQIAQINLRVKHYEDANTHFLIYLKTHPEDLTALAGVARCHRALGATKEAEAIVGKLLTLDPNNAEAYFLRAQLAWDQDQAQESLQWIRKAESLAPNDLEICQFIGVVLREVGAANEAEKFEVHRQQIEDGLRAHEALLKELLGIEASIDHNREDTIDEKTKTRCVEIRIEIGNVLMSIGQERDAIGWYLSALQEDPNNAVAKKAIGDHQRKLEERESASPAKASAPSR